MSAKDSDIKQWSDPKDYGLPFVEITPITGKAETKEASSKGPLSESISATPSSHILDTAGSSVAEVQPVTFAEEPATSQNSGKPALKEKSNSWGWIVLLLCLGIVAVIIWQIQVNKNPEQTDPAFEIVEKPVQQPSVASNPVINDSTVADQNQATVNEISIQSAADTDSNISKPIESGTTIANTATGNLIRVTAKAARAQYFIIVGSLPNEKLALKEANQYFGKSSELYLIEPFDGGRNYRLALSKSDNFRTAAAKLEEIKSQYTEELWILKY